MAFARTGFRFYTFRRVNIDDAFLMLAILATTAAIVLSHFLVPLAFFQNETSLGQLKPGSDFVGKMLMAKNLEEATSVMVWSTIYAVKYKPYVLQEVGDTGEEGPGLVVNCLWCIGAGVYFQLHIRYYHLSTLHH